MSGIPASSNDCLYKFIIFLEVEMLGERNGEGVYRVANASVWFRLAQDNGCECCGGVHKWAPSLRRMTRLSLRASFAPNLRWYVGVSLDYC